MSREELAWPSPESRLSPGVTALPRVFPSEHGSVPCLSRVGKCRRASCVFLRVEDRVHFFAECTISLSVEMKTELHNKKPSHGITDPHECYSLPDTEFFMSVIWFILTSCGQEHTSFIPNNRCHP